MLHDQIVKQKRIEKGLLGAAVVYWTIYCYKINPLYNPVMKPTKSLDQLSTKLKDMLPALKNQYHVSTLEVFGSFVHGNQTKNSDLDLLVTFNEVPTLFKFVALENYLTDTLGIKVDLVMKDSLKSAIGKRILEEARPV